ncbi:methylated-DNA--protein-cysteine methyltransferase-like isoform X3 [Biomphalaria glabrata]|uniref:Methylated-DNA--protein-cysteine methyltransferase n=1 Tax=Biomphalaria glabrata TaxID=6526 RepID=A0A9U8EDX5_BIOGL|nr:methylated-DNA--protein-cysteine methyltransferase-like isoform X2 [Biomphalaria glabrata]
MNDPDLKKKRTTKMKHSSLTCSCFESKFIVTSPIGDIKIVSCSEGLHSVSFSNDDSLQITPDKHIPVLAKSNSSNITECSPAEKCYQWLKNFFSLRKADPDIPPLCQFVMKPDTFCSKVLQCLPAAAPFGTTISYKDLAHLCGNVKASRAVGHAMSSNPFILIIPCHRVICSNGEVGNYAKGRRNTVKQWLLNFEKES